MASKESMVTAPLMVVLYDWAYRDEPWREVWRRRRGLYAGLAATWIVLVALMASGPRSGTVGFGLGVSADISINGIDDRVSAYVHDAVVDGTDLMITADNESEIQAVSGSVAAVTSDDASASLAGSFSKNDLSGSTSALAEIRA